MRLLLELPADLDRATHPELDAYLKTGEKSIMARPVRDGSLCRTRSPWWPLGKVPGPPLVVTYMARQAPYFASNPDGLAILNICHGIYPGPNLEHLAAADLATALNSERASYIRYGRTYQGGLKKKYEPSQIVRLARPHAQLPATCNARRLTLDTKITADYSPFVGHFTKNRAMVRADKVEAAGCIRGFIRKGPTSQHSVHEDDLFFTDAIRRRGSQRRLFYRMHFGTRSSTTPSVIARMASCSRSASRRGEA